MALPTVECFRGLDLLDQAQAIYEALYTGAGDSSLTPPECFKGQDPRDQLTDIFAALSAMGAGPIPPQTVGMDMIVDFSEDSGALTAAKITAGTHGPMGDLGEWSEQSTITHSSILDIDVILPFEIDVDGTLYDGSEGQGMQFNFAAEPGDADVFQFAFFDLPRTVASSIVILLYKTETTQIPGQEASYSNDIIVQEGGNYSLIQLILNFASQRLALTHSEGSFGLLLSGNENWNLAALQRNTDTGQTKLFIQECTLAGNQLSLGEVVGMSHSVTTAASLIQYIRLQSYLRPAHGGGRNLVKLFAVREGHEGFPPWDPGPMDGPQSVSANRTDVEQITLTISGPYALVRIERKTNAGAWSTLVASRDIALDSPVFQYVDNAVSVPNTYRYRMIALVGDLETSASLTDTVDLSEPFAEWHDAIDLPFTTNDLVYTNPSNNGVSTSLTLPAGTVTKLRIYISAITGTMGMKAALYDGAEALLESDEETASVTGWLEFTITPYVSAGGTFTIAWQIDVGAGETVTLRFGTGTPAQLKFGPVSYAAFPTDPLGYGGAGASAVAVGALVTPP